MPFTLLKPSFLQFKNGFTHRSARLYNLKRDLLLLCFALGTMFCIFMCCTVIFFSMKDNAFFEAIIPAKIIQLTFYSFFFLLLISNTISAIGNLYNAQNINLILAAPVSNSRIYFAKLLAIIAETSTMYFIFALPTALAYCYTLDLGVDFLLVGLSVSIPFLLIPAGISITLGTVVVRASTIFKKYKKALYVCAFIAIAFVLLMATRSLSDFEIERGEKSANIFIQSIGLFGNPNPIWLPSRWAADVITSVIGEPIQGKNIKYLLLICSAFGAIALGYLVFDLFFLTTRSIAESNDVSHTEQDPELPTTRKLALNLNNFYFRIPLNSHTRAILVKDFLTIIRDRSHSVQALLYLIIGITYVIAFKFMGNSLNVGVIANQAWLGTMAVLNTIFGGFFISSLMTRLVYPSISLEGKAFWILRSAPLDIRKLVMTKFFAWLPITTICTLTLLVSSAIALELGIGSIIATATTAISLSIGFTGLAIGLGAIFASFQWESPTKIASGLGSMVLLLCSISLVFLTTIVAASMFLLTGIPALRLTLGTRMSVSIITISILAMFLLNSIAAKWACQRGIRSLRISAMEE